MICPQTEEEEATECVSWYICLAVLGKAPHRHQFLLTKRAQPLTDTAVKRTNGKASTAGIFADHRAEDSLLPEGPSSLEPSTQPGLWQTKEAKGNGYQHWSNTGDTSSILPVSSGFFRAQLTKRLSLLAFLKTLLSVYIWELCFHGTLTDVHQEQEQPMASLHHLRALVAQD